MELIARVGDIGIGVCPNHDPPQIYTTTFSTGAENVYADGKKVCVVGTVGISTCGHNTVAQTGSPVTIVEGKPVHRVGDIGANYGEYVVTSGSPTCSSN